MIVNFLQDYLKFLKLSSCRFWIQLGQEQSTLSTRPKCWAQRAENEAERTSDGSSISFCLLNGAQSMGAIKILITNCIKSPNLARVFKQQYCNIYRTKQHTNQ